MTVFMWVGFLVATVILGAVAVRALLRKQRGDQAIPAYPPTTLLTTAEASRIWLRRGRLSVPKRAP